MKRNDVLAAIRAHTSVELQSNGLRKSAVLVPLRNMADGSDGFELILTRRTEDLPSHAGQVSFPGGGVQEDDEGPTHTALRETHEELGIAPSHIQVVGPLDQLNTITGFHIVPIAGVVQSEVELCPDAREVARVFTVPLDVILDDNHWQEHTHSYKGSEILLQEIRWDGERIWGVTAFILRRFCDMLKLSVPRGFT